MNDVRTVAVIGATGTAGTRTVRELRNRGVEVVEISRAAGVDLLTGKGLREALKGVDVVVDASNAFPADDSVSVTDAIVTAAENVVEACVAEGVGHLVLLSIIGIEDPVFDDHFYYVAKRAQEKAVAAGAVPVTIVKTSQWMEFATNPAAVTFTDDEVIVQDWLVQPVAADAVAAELATTALAAPGGTRLLTGPWAARLPDVTARLLARRGDTRPVRTVPPALDQLSQGVLLAPADAEVVGPDLVAWLESDASLA